jgi:hypothetical protein
MEVLHVQLNTEGTDNAKKMRVSPPESKFISANITYNFVKIMFIIIVVIGDKGCNTALAGSMEVGVSAPSAQRKCLIPLE